MSEWVSRAAVRSREQPRASTSQTDDCPPLQCDRIERISGSSQPSIQLWLPITRRLVPGVEREAGAKVKIRFTRTSSRAARAGDLSTIGIEGTTIHETSRWSPRLIARHRVVASPDPESIGFDDCVGYSKLGGAGIPQGWSDGPPDMPFHLFETHRWDLIDSGKSTWFFCSCPRCLRCSRYCCWWW